MALTWYSCKVLFLYVLSLNTNVSVTRSKSLCNLFSFLSDSISLSTPPPHQRDTITHPFSETVIIPHAFSHAHIHAAHCISHSHPLNWILLIMITTDHQNNITNENNNNNNTNGKGYTREEKGSIYIIV